MKRFRIRLNIGISGDVSADHYEVSDGVVRFYDPQAPSAPVAVYALASVCSVEVIRSPESQGFAERYQPKGGFDPWYLHGRRNRPGGR